MIKVNWKNLVKEPIPRNNEGHQQGFMASHLPWRRAVNQEVARIFCCSHSNLAKGQCRATVTQPEGVLQTVGREKIKQGGCPTVTLHGEWGTQEAVGTGREGGDVTLHRASSDLGLR